MKATLTFQTRHQAEAFAIAWGRYSKTGHIIASGMENVVVTVFDVTEDDKKWINNYIENINQQNKYQL